MSTSNPTILSPSTDSIGGHVASLPTVNVPGLIVGGGRTSTVLVSMVTVFSPNHFS